jgi:DinB superfamily
VEAEDFNLQTATATLALTGSLVDYVIERIQSDQWLNRPAPTSTHVLWIVGHLATTRDLLVQVLGGGMESLDPLFAGGRPLPPDDALPSPATVAARWRETRARADQVVRTLSRHDLDRPSPEGVPTLNGRISGVLAAWVFHEAYHVGQLGYLMRWLEYPPLLGR